MRSSIIFTLIFLTSYSFSFAQDENADARDGFGLSLAANYTFSGIGMIMDVEWQKRHHVFYTGPKLPISKTYLPFKGPLGWNLGYRHEYNRGEKKRISLFFNVDYQVAISNAYSGIEESEKKNYIHELFVGYGAQLRLTERLYLCNVIGVGGYLESYYNVDLKFRRNYGGYNHLFKFFLNYKF